MAYQDILFDVEGGVATITLNRPDKLNAWTAVMSAELGQALAHCHDDDAVRAVVITGAGDRAFCAGADLGRGGATFANRERGQRDERPATPGRMPHEIDKPVIAAINGHAVGVGMTYPLLADVRIVAEDAKIAFPFVRRGVMPELGSHVTVARVVGFSNAADLLLTGRTLSGREAAAMGLASRALPAAQVLPAALEMAADIARNTAPASVAAAKRLLWAGLTASVPEMMRREEPLFAWFGNQPDAREGVTSFVEKRAPAWSQSSRELPEDLFGRR
ncbi:MAG: enoyl-CoA hydratase-related protein [Pseudomonadales bacterium]